MAHENHSGSVDVEDKLRSFDEVFAPRRIGHLNDQVIKIAKVQGEFVWHRHEDTDELFIVQRGILMVRYRDRDVRVEAGQLHVVPRGVEHTTSSEAGCEVVVIERANTVNTGSAAGHAFTASDEPFI